MITYLEVRGKEGRKRRKSEFQISGLRPWDDIRSNAEGMGLAESWLCYGSSWVYEPGIK